MREIYKKMIANDRKKLKIILFLDIHPIAIPSWKQKQLSPKRE
jgi:hypothetical protein